jgi:hypothetical protein
MSAFDVTTDAVVSELTLACSFRPASDPTGPCRDKALKGTSFTLDKSRRGELIDQDIDLSLIATRAQTVAFDLKRTARSGQMSYFDTKWPLTIRS